MVQQGVVLMPETRALFTEMSERSNRVANYLRGLGVERGDRILLMLGNVVPLWEVMLAAMKLGALKSLGADGGGFQPHDGIPRAMSVSAASPLAIEPGLITLHESVNATWEMTAP